MKFLPSYFQDLERELRNLALELHSQLTDSERRWIAEFLDAGEYGLAMSRILECLQRSGNTTPSAIVEKARALALRMNLIDEVDEHLPPTH